MISNADTLLDKIVKLVFIVTSLIFSYTAGFGSFSDLIQRALLITLLCSTVFLTRPLKISGKSNVLTKTLDVLLTVCFVVSGVYIMVIWQDRILKSGSVPFTDVIMGTIMVLLLLEITRRTVGKFLTVTTVIFLLYALFGPYLPSALSHRGESWSRLITFLYTTTEGIFGIPAGIASSFIIIFVIFGAFLETFGAGQWFVDTSYAITGRFRGGPAKTAILSSALMGMISGSPAANVATTGTFTIPLMKQTGYKPHVAGAIEAVASTGGMFTPPIMGAAAFIMAEYLEMPYFEVAKSAIVPALLYYLSLMLAVDSIAIKNNLMGLPPEKLPSVKKTMQDRGYFIIPLLFLITMIVAGWSPMKAAFWATIIVFLVAFIKKETRPSIKLILKALEDGAKQVVPIVATCATAGIIVGVISITGLGAKLSYTLISISQGNVFIGAIFAAIITIILGCGMPPTAVYIILATILAPPLVEMGVHPVSAHMFIFMFACIGALTPPVAITAYTAAGIANSDPTKTGLRAFRLGLVAYIIPFMFLVSPSMLLVGDTLEIITTVFSSLVGILCLVSSIEGYFLQHWCTLPRVLLGIAALLMLKPGVMTDMIGLGLILVSIFLNGIFSRKVDNVSDTV